MTFDNRRPAPALITAAVLLFGSWPPHAARADRVVVGGRENLGAQMINMQQGRLRFRQADGVLVEAWADEIEHIHVEHGGAFTDFNEAEKLMADGRTPAAIPRYTRSLRLVTGFWPDFISIRLVQACNEAGDYDEAVEHFLRVLSGPHAGPAAAARILPDRVPIKRNARVTRALAHLAAALDPRTAPADAHRPLLHLLRFDILDQTADPETPAAAREAVRESIAAAARSSRVYAIVYRACEVLARSGAQGDMLAALELAISDCPMESLPEFLMLKGATLLETAAQRDEVIRATWPLMRVAIHFAEHPLAPRALYESAVAVERIGLGRGAAGLLRECLRHAKVTPSTAGLAETALKRLQSGGMD